MNQFKALLLAGGIAVVGSHAALAAPMLSYQVFDNGVMIVDSASPGANSSTGSISASGAAPHFSALNLTVTGVPLVATPQLGATASITSDSTVTASAPVTFRVLITQTGLTSPTGTFNAFNTIGLNNLNGSVVSQVTDFIDPGNGAFAQTVQIGSLSNAGGVSNSNGTGLITTVNVGAGPFSETVVLTGTFSRSSDTLQFTDQITSTQQAPTPTVPEPASLALIGTALFGFGLIRRRRNRS